MTTGDHPGWQWSSSPPQPRSLVLAWGQSAVGRTAAFLAISFSHLA